MPIPVPLPVPIHAANNAVVQQRLDHPRILVSPRNLIYTGVALLSTGLINAVIGGVLVSKYQNSETVGKDIGLSQLGVGSVFVTTGLAMLTFGAFRLLAEETVAAARIATSGLQPANIPVAQPVAAAGNDLQVHVVHLPGGAMAAASLGVPIDQEAGASKEAPVIVINPK